MASSEPRPTNFLNDGSKSTADAYYEWMLRKEKLSNILTSVPAGAEGWLTQAEKDALGTIGEKEKLEIKILARLSGLADSSPELLQVKALTDCKSREECARSLADIYYRKYTTEEILNRFVAPEDTKKTILDSSRKTSSDNYTLWGKARAE
jgi:hypothetical protein